MTSLTTPEARTTSPTGSEKSCSSERIRDKTGNAVMLDEVPINVINVVNLIEESINSLYNPTETAQPRPNGMTRPAVETAMVGRAFLLRREKSTSVPITNRNRTRPKLAINDKYGIESVGKMFSVKPGIWPNAVGPRRIPARISETTRGWRAHLNANARIRERIKIRQSWTMTRTRGLQDRGVSVGMSKGQATLYALVRVDPDGINVSSAQDRRRVPACHPCLVRVAVDATKERVVGGCVRALRPLRRQARAKPLLNA